MQIERSPGTSNVIDVLDRVLDKGIVIDAWGRLSAVGIELVTIEARIVVASISTYVGYSSVLAELSNQQQRSPPELRPATRRSSSRR
jgi:hypothetical protein